MTGSYRIVVPPCSKRVLKRTLRSIRKHLLDNEVVEQKAIRYGILKDLVAPDEDKEDE